MKKVFLLLFIIPCILFSQEITSEELQLKNGEIVLPGTLSYLKSKKKIPLAIFIHGSGNVDRNGNQAGLNVKAGYIKTLSEELNKLGIAFYRYDKRTATPANIKLSKNIFLTHFVEDAQVAINHYKDDERFNKIYLIGHSQGSLIAMLAITKDIDGYISLAGAGETIDKIIIKQVKAQNADLGNIAEAHFEELDNTDTIQEVNPFLISLFHPNNQKFVKNWAEIDPQLVIKKITIPILILNGDADQQVSVKDAENLKASNPKAILHIITKMNHVLKEVNSPTENQQSYSDPNFPMSKELIQLIVDFVKK